MTTTYATPYNGMASQPFQLPTAEQGHGAKRLMKRCLITMASQASGDTIKLGTYPKGCIPCGGEITVDTSTSSSTVAIGISGTTAKYKAAAAVTTTDVPQRFGKAAALVGAPLAAEEEVLLTLGSAALPSSGLMVVDLFYTQP